MIKPDFLFETSWEVCNKVGGIHTVIATKSLSLKEKLGDNYIVIGPDVWKETRENPEFIEDNSIYEIWKERAIETGLKIRIGRWNIPARPIAILVDFTPLFVEKNQIFGKLWEDYKLDSISGHWDYIEPALFGYAAGKVIESFYSFYFSAEDKIVAQFHEWMTGGGVLFLHSNVPQIGTVFTTHATVLGRSLAGNAVPVYDKLENINSNKMADDFDVRAKYSLEKLSAKYCDSFTTVSEITGRECRHFLGKTPDVITANGFDESLVPDSKILEDSKAQVRKRMIEVASAVCGHEISDDAHLIINSGRYEFKNKGIDLFIDALDNINRRKTDKHVVAFIAIPANQAGPKKEVKERLLGKTKKKEGEAAQFRTHNLYDEGNDIILRSIHEHGFKNTPDQNVTVIYIPAYLDGNDGIVDLTYYDVLTGMDLSVFPSYYEPWGYTPLESLAFHVPSVTTSLAGFGLWVRKHYHEKTESLVVINRNDNNDNEVIDEIARIITAYCSFDKIRNDELKENAFEVSKIALWRNLISNYQKAFDQALQKSLERYDQYKNKMQYPLIERADSFKYDQPEWKSITIDPYIPKKLQGLQTIAYNFWWSWNYEASDLFVYMDKALWEKVEHNPVSFLQSLSLDKIKALGRNQNFLIKYNQVLEKFNIYLAARKKKKSDLIAYFSMEIGLHENLKTYSGGLGVLAGDFIKEASDQNMNMIAVSIFYKYGYFQQSLSAFGEQIAHYIPQETSQLPLLPVLDKKGKELLISIAFPGRNLYAKVWRVEVGSVPMYLLDTDIEKNNPEDRKLTHQLYGGDNEYRLKQELLLGVGGVRLLSEIGLNPAIFHSNEGHSAFSGVERLRNFIEKEKLTFDQAYEMVRATTLFTTHTPVPAGHDVFSEDLLRTYIPHYASRLNLEWDRFMNLGREKKDSGDKFSMSVLALNLSEIVNGVSKLHGKVTREMFSKYFQGYFSKELQIGYVTNGVHYGTWASKVFQKLYKEKFGEGFEADHSNSVFWSKIKDVPDDAIWNSRLEMKRQLLSFLKSKIETDLTRRQENPKVIFEILDNLREDALVIGFARRFATYKRAHLLFSNLERLASLLNNKDRPVIFLYSGKAHPNDTAGQDLIKRILEISRKPEFVGKIIFLENYNIHIARNLVHGVDVWLNTPTRLLEASGTSGQKAALNGVLNLSVLDGWWAEGYQKNAGWAIKKDKTYSNQHFQDELDAETVYNIIENEVVPLFFEKDEKGLPHNWINYVKNTIAKVAPHFTMKRMMNEYRTNFYNALLENANDFNKNNFELAKEMVKWKRKVCENWNSVEIKSVKVHDVNQKRLKLGDDFTAKVMLNAGDLSGEDIAVDVVFREADAKIGKGRIHIHQMERVKNNQNQATWHCKLVMDHAGSFDYSFRIRPKHSRRTAVMDLGLTKWI